MKCAYCGSEVDSWSFRTDPWTKEQTCPNCYAPKSRAFKEPESELETETASSPRISSSHHELNIPSLVQGIAALIIVVMFISALWPFIQNAFNSLPSEFTTAFMVLIPFLIMAFIILAFSYVLLGGSYHEN